MYYTREEFINWLDQKYPGRFEEEKIHDDLTPCINWKGKSDKLWKVPRDGGKMVCRIVAAHVRGSLSKNESPYRVCCNKRCINFEHFVITKKGETCWFHKDPDTYFKRKERMTLYAKRLSVRAAENLVSDRVGCVAKPSHVRSILRKNAERQKSLA